MDVGGQTLLCQEVRRFQSAGRLQVVCGSSASEGALQQTLAAAAGRTLVLLAEPVHHVTGVSSVTTAEAEVGGAAYGHVTDGALEGETLADGALSAASLTAAVTAVHAELCGETTQRMNISSTASVCKHQKPSDVRTSFMCSHSRLHDSAALTLTRHVCTIKTPHGC